MEINKNGEKKTDRELRDSVVEIDDLKSLKPLLNRLDDRTVLSVSLEGQVSSDGQET